jgi:hypothetical protein
MPTPPRQGIVLGQHREMMEMATQQLFASTVQALTVQLAAVDFGSRWSKSFVKEMKESDKDPWDNKTYDGEDSEEARPSGPPALSEVDHYIIAQHAVEYTRAMMAAMGIAVSTQGVLMTPRTEPKQANSNEP